MTKTELNAIVQAVTAALSATSNKSYPAVKTRAAYRNPRISKAVTDPKLDRQLQRRASIARGFSRKGIKVTFDEATGRFDNVKPYKIWLSEGLVVMKGQHGVRGLFHKSQCEVYNKPATVHIENPTIGMQIPA